MTVDGTDFHVGKPDCPIKGRWKSHKFKGAGLWCEIAICIQTGNVVWINGPFPAGECPDFKIFHLCLQKMLLEGEMVETDDGCAVFGRPIERCCLAKMDTDVFHVARAQARACHEAINARLKSFKVLNDRIFCHDISFHGTCLHAVALLVQMQMETTHPIFQVNYPFPGTS